MWARVRAIGNLLYFETNQIKNDIPQQVLLSLCFIESDNVYLYKWHWDSEAELWKYTDLIYQKRLLVPLINISYKVIRYRKTPGMYY